MNIKRRIIFSNMAGVIIPLVLTTLTGLIYLVIVSGVFHKNIGYENYKKMIALKTELFETKTSILTRDVGVVQEADIQNYIKERVSAFKGKAAIIKNQKVIYSSIGINKIDIEKCIEAIRDNSLSSSIKMGKVLYMTESIPLQFKDGTSGNIILLAPIEEEAQLLSAFLILIVGTFVVSFIAVNTIVSYLFSKKILKPVELLKGAAAEISSGNLDCEVSEAGDEEIAELCRDFERMRVQLKDSIHTKMKYDENRSVLISSISHDLKTPITSIKGYVEGILDGVANSPEKLDNYLRTIYSKAGLIDTLIDDLLLYSKLDLNQLPFNFEKLDALEYFRYCVFDSSVELEKKNIKISLVNNLSGTRYISIDRERMRRVMMNIIDNSKKYMNKEEGVIVISLRETNFSIVIEIRDNGCGVDKEEANKIFDRFYRGDAARTGTKGTGLGLAIAKQIVEGHKGTIWAKSYGDKGTSIMISLAKQKG